VTPATTNTPSANTFQLLPPSTVTPVVRGTPVTVTDAVVDMLLASVGGQLVQDIAASSN